MLGQQSALENFIVGVLLLLLIILCTRDDCPISLHVISGRGSQDVRLSHFPCTKYAFLAESLSHRNPVFKN